MKKQLYLLLILGLGIFFYQKKSYDSLLIILSLAIFLLMFGFDMDSMKEHAGNVSINTLSSEALQNLSSMYNNGILTATSLNLAGNLTVGGNLTAKGGANITGNLTAGGGTTNITGGLTVDNINCSGNINVSGNSGNVMRSDLPFAIASGNANGNGLVEGTGTTTRGSWQTLTFQKI